MTSREDQEKQYREAQEVAYAQLAEERLLFGHGTAVDPIEVSDKVRGIPRPRPEAFEHLVEQSQIMCSESDAEGEASDSSSGEGFDLKESDDEVVVEGPVKKKPTVGVKQPLYSAAVVRGLRWDDERDQLDLTTPDVGGYFDEFQLTPAERIKICRSYASYIAAQIAPARPPVQKKQKK